MALLDIAIRLHGRNEAQLMFPQLRDMQVAIQVPETAVVNNTFIKIMRPHKGGAKEEPGTGLVTPMGNTIAFREFVSFDGTWHFAFQGLHAETLNALLVQLTYLGKRGSFLQLVTAPTTRDTNSEQFSTQGYVLLTKSADHFDFRGVLQVVDDCASMMTFEHADIYSNKSIRPERERIFHRIVLPYALKRSSKGYSYYERFTD